MPNHVTSKITVSGPAEDVAAFKALMIHEEAELYGSYHKDPALRGQPTGATLTVFDFNRIIPMPEIIQSTESSSDASLWLFALGHADREMGSEMTRLSPLAYPWVQREGITTRDELRAWLE